MVVFSMRTLPVDQLRALQQSYEEFSKRDSTCWTCAEFC